MSLTPLKLVAARLFKPESNHKLSLFDLLCTMHARLEVLQMHCPDLELWHVPGCVPYKNYVLLAGYFFFALLVHFLNASQHEAPIDKLPDIKCC